MDEYISEVAVYDISTNTRPNFAWPDTISVYFSDKLYKIFENNPKYLEKISKPNMRNLYDTVFQRHSDIIELKVENFCSFYSFTTICAELSFEHLNMKFVRRDMFLSTDRYGTIGNVWVLIDDPEYSKIAHGIKYASNWSSGPGISKYGRYYDKLTISRQLLENYITGNNKKIMPTIST